MCRIESTMDYSITYKRYGFVDKRPKCAKCRTKSAVTYENHYFFCGDCAVERLNLNKTKKTYSSVTKNKKQ